MGPRSNVANYKVITLENDTYIQLGNSKLRVLHTPGHT
jgi:glyoxylase-like metal-dependent hydrolase (beta-lactamase superfamily II)